MSFFLGNENSHSSPISILYCITLFIYRLLYLVKMQAVAIIASPLPSLRNFNCNVPSSFISNNAQRNSHLSTRTAAVIGIDLGTTNSAIAYVGPEGPEVITDADGHGQDHHTAVPHYVLPGEAGGVTLGWPGWRAGRSPAPPAARLVPNSTTPQLDPPHPAGPPRGRHTGVLHPDSARNGKGAGRAGRIGRVPPALF